MAKTVQIYNTKGSITVLLTSCFTGLDWSVLKIKTKIVSCQTVDSKPVKQEVNGTVILPPSVLPGPIHSNLFFLIRLFCCCSPTFFIILLLINVWSICDQSLPDAFIVRNKLIMPAKSYWSVRLSTVDLLVTTRLDYVLLILKLLFTIFIKQATLMRRSTVRAFPLS